MSRRINRASESVDPALVDRVEQILTERNVGGLVPLEIAERILDDMAAIVARSSSWSDRYRHDRGFDQQEAS